jgi:aspartyl-tRNA(Asn)/glutamyl-tRNA(Gln) amidotransferase subunit A
MNGAVSLTIRGASDRIRSGALDAVELMQSCLDATDRLDNQLNVFVTRVDREVLLQQAADVDRQRQAGLELGLLAGIPIALKDIYFTSDLPTTASSKVLAGHRTNEDAFTVTKLRQAGALIVGKLQTHEFAYGPTTVNEFAGPSRNPWNPDHVPGGSSGGSAIAVATGMCLGATGSDTGGSIRHPSAFCGVTGLKPTYGLISRRGLFSLSWSLDHAGPITRTVDDAAFMLQVMAGFDSLEPGSAQVPIPDYVAEIGQTPVSSRVGIPREHFLDLVDGEVRAAFEASLRTLEGLGYSIQEVSIPNLRYALGAELAILSAEASSYHREMMRVRADDVSSDIRRELDSGMVLLATDYLLGQRVRRIIAEEFRAAFQKVDVLATPTIPIPAPRIGQSEVNLAGQTMSTLNVIWRNTYPANLTGSPALCVPCGFSEGGLPISLQLIGRNFDELTLLQAGHRFQSETNWHTRTPPMV